MYFKQIAIQIRAMRIKKKTTENIIYFFECNESKHLIIIMSKSLKLFTLTNK